MSPRRSSVLEIKCDSLETLHGGIEKIHAILDVQDGESLWFRGSRDSRYSLSPTLMRDTEGLSKTDHDNFEMKLFFEFQLRAAELRALQLSDWEYLFYGRHYGVPTRVLDWTDTFGIALYFATEMSNRPNEQSVVDRPDPTIWVLNPFALNLKSWECRDIVVPRYLGLDNDRNYLDFGELLAEMGEWPWEMPVAISPIQINDRVRAQRGWFTIHGQDRRPLEMQAPSDVVKLVLEPKCVSDASKFLNFAGINPFSIYPDLDHLAGWLRTQYWQWAEARRNSKRMENKTRKPHVTRALKSRRGHTAKLSGT
jgi:hypothetical protein